MAICMHLELIAFCIGVHAPPHVYASPLFTIGVLYEFHPEPHPKTRGYLKPTRKPTLKSADTR
jgi:hypothetical protein